MKIKNIPLLLALVTILTGVSACQTTPNQPSLEDTESTPPSISDDEKHEIITTALNSLKNTSYELEVNEIYTINYPGKKYYVGTYQNHSYKIGYYYDGDNKAYSVQSESLFADLDTMTGEIVEQTKRKKIVPYTLYHKNLENNYTVIEELGVNNVISTKTYEVFDPVEQKYIPVVFDDNFINPFDYIQENDIQVIDYDTISINNIEKGNFLLDSYNVLAKLVEDNTVYLKLNAQKHIEQINVEIIENIIGDKVITNNVTITLTDTNIEEFPHVTPFTNNNPDLSEAFAKYTNLTNYTYTKTLAVDGATVSHIEGYFTPELVLFHNGSLSDGQLYQGGDTYDIKCEYNPDTEVFDIYQYLINVEEYEWSQVMATDNLAYTLNTLKDIGPNYENVDPAIFKNIGNNQYQAENLVVSTLGQYFDYGVMGVDSFFLETQTLDCVIALTDDNNISNIQVSAHLENNDYLFTFEYRDINSTTIPTWINPAE